MKFRRLAPTRRGSNLSNLIHAQSHSVYPQFVPFLGYNGCAMRQKLASTVAETRCAGDWRLLVHQIRVAVDPGSSEVFMTLRGVKAAPGTSLPPIMISLVHAGAR
jgi:hypothetical protein